MRKTAPLLAAFLLVFPPAAFAAVNPAPTPSEHNADTGTTVQPKDDPCYSLTLTISDGSPVQTYSKSPNSACEKMEKNYSSPDEACKDPDFKKQANTYKWTDSSGTSHTGNRCDQLAGTQPDGTPTDTGTFAARSIAQNVIDSIDPGTDVGKTELVQALQNLGVSQTDAQAAVAQNADQVKSMLSDIASGNSADAQQLAQTLQLNPDVLNKISSLQPSDLPGVLNDVASQDQESAMNQALNSPDTFQSPDTTGPTPDTTQTGQCGVGGYAGNLAYAETRCGANTTNPYSSVQGPYQFLCSTWNSYANSTGNGQYTCSCGSGGGYAGTCSYVNDPAISSNVVNSYYNNWIQTSQGQACIAAGNTDTSCVYAYHWLGSGGLNAALNLETSNPNGSATALCNSAAAAACSPGNMSVNNLTMSQVFQQLDNRMGIGSSPTIITAMASPPSSPLGTIAGGSGASDTNNMGIVSPGLSPLATVSNVPTAGQSYVPTAGQSYGTSNSSLNSLLPILLLKNLLGSLTSSSATPPPQTTPTPGTGGTPTTVTPSVTITAQPPIVVPGNPIQLSWSSVGAVSNPPCQIAENGHPFALGGSGVTSVPTSSSTPVGKMTFAIQCTGTNGQSLQQSASVIIN